MHSDHNANPFNRLPPVVVILALAMAAIEIVLQLGSRGILGGASAVGWRIEAWNAFAYSPELFERLMANGILDPRALSRFLTYSFVHFDFLHMAMVAVFTLALGKMVAEVFSSVAVLAIFFGAAIMGALAYTLLLDDPIALIGGFPAAYGLIGAYTFLLWTGLGATGQNRLKAFQLIGFLMAIQLVFGVLFGGTNSWVAEGTGFATGFGLSFVVSPGGVSRVMARLRQR